MQCSMQLEEEERAKGLPSSMFWRVIPLTKKVVKHHKHTSLRCLLICRGVCAAMTYFLYSHST